MDRRFTHHERVARKFAHRIGLWLSEARRKGAFGDLVIAAEPHFLGLLRGELDAETRSALRHEVPREYAQGSDEEIRARILEAIIEKGR
jgi:protein required for attachment to host cells